MNFDIKVLPHSAQRYDTVGDYWMRHVQQIEIRISDFSEALSLEGSSTALELNGKDIALAEKYEFLVAIHELVEAFLCYQAKVPFEEIDKFDFSHALNEKAGEPGDAIDAPYHNQHVTATAIEHAVAQQLGVDWEAYEKAVQRLSEKEQEKEA